MQDMIATFLRQNHSKSKLVKIFHKLCSKSFCLVLSETGIAIQSLCKRGCREENTKNYIWWVGTLSSKRIMVKKCYFESNDFLHLKKLWVNLDHFESHHDPFIKILRLIHSKLCLTTYCLLSWVVNQMSVNQNNTNLPCVTLIWRYKKWILYLSQKTRTSSYIILGNFYSQKAGKNATSSQFFGFGKNFGAFFHFTKKNDHLDWGALNWSIL